MNLPGGMHIFPTININARLPGGSAVKKKKKKSTCEAGDTGWSLGCEDPLERKWRPTPVIFTWVNSLHRGAWWATVHWVAIESDTN